MDLQLAGKHALVTGSSSGIGAAIALALAAEGVVVGVHGRDAARVRQVVETVLASGGAARGFVADLDHHDDVQRLIEEATTHLGTVEILVNNAGRYRDSSWSSATDDDWMELYRANVVSAVRLIRDLAAPMARAGWGRIVQIASGEATQPFATMPEYAATKAAMANLTVSLSKHLAGTGVTVNTISPGIIATDGVKAFYGAVAVARGWGEGWPQLEAGVLRDVLPNTVGRLGQVEDVAALTAFVASPRAGYINGAYLRVDGGSTPTVT